MHYRNDLSAKILPDDKKTRPCEKARFIGDANLQDIPFLLQSCKRTILLHGGESVVDQFQKLRVAFFTAIAMSSCVNGSPASCNFPL